MRSRDEDDTESSSTESLKKGQNGRHPRFVKNSLEGVDTSVVVLNACRSQYVILEEIAMQLGWVFEKGSKSETWDVCWTDSEVGPDQLFQMHEYQKISHFPGINVLARKNCLGKGLMKMRKGSPEEYDFFPLTWSLPSEFNELSLYVANLEAKQHCIFIVKPQASCQGKGIFLTKSISQLQGSNYVVQRYLENPLLINKLKFDFRIYVLVAGCDPLRAYIYNEGLARFATQNYKNPKQKNFKSACVHLTNYSLNKKNPNFIKNQSEDKMDVGHKRSLSSIFTYLGKTGVDTDLLKQRINDLVVKTLISAQPFLAHMYRLSQPNNYANDMCFQILGFDIILDSKMQPFLLEVNHNPSLVADTPLDKFIKKKLVKDTLNLLHIDTKAKAQKVIRKLQAVSSKQNGAKTQKPTGNERESLREGWQLSRDEFQSAHLGGFTKIFPVTEPDRKHKYESLLEVSYQLFKEVSGIKRFVSHERQPTKEDKPRRSLSISKNNSVLRCSSKKESRKHSKKDISNQFVAIQEESKRLFKVSRSAECRHKLPQIERQKGKFLTPQLFYLNDWSIPSIPESRMPVFMRSPADKGEESPRKREGVEVHGRRRGQVHNY